MLRMRNIALVGLLTCLAPAALHAQRQIYKCIENGKVIYSERKVCAELPTRAAGAASEADDLPPDGVDVAAEIQADFDREVAAKRAEQDAQRARAAAEEAARAKAQADCKAEMSRKAVVFNSGWDGSVFQAEDYLKRRYLRDPDSYESVGWTMVERSCSGYRVSGSFRARNGFGGMTVETATFEFDTKGNVINMVR